VTPDLETPNTISTQTLESVVWSCHKIADADDTLFVYLTMIWQCHSSGGCSPASHISGPGSRPGDVRVGSVVDRVALG
jgi:hypothetical protein